MPSTRPCTGIPTKNVEDEECQRLLLLGAKRFDSYNRYGFVTNLADNEEREIEDLEDGRQPLPTMVERRWVSVGIPSKPEGGFWALLFERLEEQGPRRVRTFD